VEVKNKICFSEFFLFVTALIALIVLLFITHARLSTLNWQGYFLLRHEQGMDDKQWVA